MKHRVTIGDTTVLCSDTELELLCGVCLNFMGGHLSAFSEDDDFDTTIVDFDKLNVPTSDAEELCVSCFGDDGYKPNSIADIDAKRYYGVYFNVLIFLDGCTTFFRTDDKNCLND